MLLALLLAETVLPCRPTVACTAQISAPGQLEIEAGVQDKRTTGSRVDSAPLLFKLSLNEHFQLQLGTPGPTLVSGAGAERYFDATQALAKVAWGFGATTVGATAAVNLPTAAGIERRTDALFALLASQDLIGFHADLNFGLNLLGIGDDAQRQEWVALSVSHDLPLDLTASVEGWHSTAAGQFADRDGGFLFSLGWSPATWICIDAGGDIAFASDRRFSVFAGVTFAAARLWTPR